jgi:C4-dicarboxylate-specific signal transduction histidine kinase
MENYPAFVTKTHTSLYATEQGEALWQFLNGEISIERMQAVSDVGKPALLAVEPRLIQMFSIPEKGHVAEQDKPQYDRLKQMLGAMVRQVMELNGYQYQSSNIKTPNSKLFYSASLYKKTSE